MRGMRIRCLSLIYVFNINDPTFHLQLSIPQVQAFVTSRGETIQVQQKPVSSNLYIPNSKKVALGIGHWQLGIGAYGTQCNALLE